MASQLSKAEAGVGGLVARIAGRVRSYMTVYKPGQGVRARVVLLATAGLMAFFCGQWLRKELIEKALVWSYGVPLGVGGLILSYFF